MSAGGQINWDSIAPRADAGAVNWDSIAPRANPGPETSQHVQGHPLKGQNFGDWLSEELLGPVVNAATQLGRGIQGLGHPEQRPLTESAKDVVEGGMAIATPFAMGGLNSEAAPAGPPSAGAPGAVGTALKGGAMGAVKAIPRAAETSILKYTGIPQIARGAYQGAKEALKARAEAAAPPPAEAAAPAPPVAPTEEEQLLAAIQRGQQNAASQASAPQKAYVARPPEYYGVKAAEVPPSNPASAPSVSAQPASAAPSVPIGRPSTRSKGPSEPVTVGSQAPEAQDIDFQQRYGEKEQPEVAKFLGYDEPGPKPASTAASVAKTVNAKAKGDRFVTAIQQYNQKNTVTGVQPITADAIARLDDAGKSVLTRALVKNGYLRNTETFTNASFPYILQGLRDAEAAAARQTIRPPAGFSMGAMKNY